MLLEIIYAIGLGKEYNVFIVYLSFALHLDYLLPKFSNYLSGEMSVSIATESIHKLQTDPCFSHNKKLFMKTANITIAITIEK